jgi:hypothetical protein
MNGSALSRKATAESLATAFQSTAPQGSNAAARVGGACSRASPRESTYIAAHVRRERNITGRQRDITARSVISRAAAGYHRDIALGDGVISP